MKGKNIVKVLAVSVICLLMLVSPIGISQPINEKNIESTEKLSSSEIFSYNFKNILVEGKGSIGSTRGVFLTSIIWRTYTHPNLMPAIKISNILGFPILDENEPSSGSALGFFRVSNNDNCIMIQGFAISIIGRTL